MLRRHFHRRNGRVCGRLAAVLVAVALTSACGSSSSSPAAGANIGTFCKAFADAKGVTPSGGDPRPVARKTVLDLAGSAGRDGEALVDFVNQSAQIQRCYVVDGVPKLKTCRDGRDTIELPATRAYFVNDNGDAIAVPEGASPQVDPCDSSIRVRGGP